MILTICKTQNRNYETFTSDEVHGDKEFVLRLVFGGHHVGLKIFIIS